MVRSFPRAKTRYLPGFSSLMKKSKLWGFCSSSLKLAKMEMTSFLAKFVEISEPLG